MRGKVWMGAAALAVAALLPTAKSQAGTFTFGTFESGLDGFATQSGGARAVDLAQSTVVSTEGTHSLKLTQHGDGFSFDMNRTSSGDHATDAFYQAFNQASVDPDASIHLSFDAIYHHADIPDGGNFINMTIAENNDGGFRQVDGVALDDGAHIQGNIDQTIHVDIPFSSFGGFGDKLPSNSSFYQIVVALNGDWNGGAGANGGPNQDASVYFDNFQLTSPSINTPEPASVGLLSLVAIGGFIRRRRA